MNTSLSWIKAYVPDLDVTAQEYTDAMTLSGTKVEGFEKLDADLDKIVIGQIDKIEKHPDADKLIICQVNIGTETIQIVTGAPNVKEGDKVPVVLAGGRVAGGHEPGQRVEGGIKIKKGKLRGVESDGMMCSIEELGSNREMYPEAPEYGIYIFDDDAVVGESAIKSLGLDDVVVEYEITSNRVDCFSVVGIAREAAATFNKAFYPPVVTPTGNDENAADYIKVTVKNPELCPRYCARIVKNIKIGPSPKWMQRRLASVGIRPINNLVDITNYVMEEYGQPMHAYDLDTIEGKEITQYFGIVSGETIIGANVFKDFFAGIRDIVGGRAGSYESVLREAKETALKEMSDHAARMGANAVIAVDLDYETVGGSGSMLMVTAAGTAVRYQ